MFFTCRAAVSTAWFDEPFSSLRRLQVQIPGVITLYADYHTPKPISAAQVGGGGLLHCY